VLLPAIWVRVGAGVEPEPVTSKHNDLMEVLLLLLLLLPVGTRLMWRQATSALPARVR
jgi:uncharacterized membrane protein